MSKKPHHLRPKYQAHATRQVADATARTSTLRKTASKDVASPMRIWNELESMRLDTLGVATTAMATHSLLRDPVQMGKLNSEQSATIRQTTQTLDAEVKRLLANFTTISSQHKGRTGAATDENDAHLASILHGQYIQWTDDWERAIFPLLETITEVFADANQLTVSVNPANEQPDENYLIVTEKSATPSAQDELDTTPDPSAE